jgi:L-fuculose-phosphate aldolase
MPEAYVGRKFNTVFVGGGKPDLDKVRGIVAAGRKLNDLGLTPENAGNISVRSRRGMLITPGGKNKGKLVEGDVCEVLDFSGGVATVVGGVEPSSEVPMHWLIYQKFPKVNAVVHAHDSRVTENPIGLVVTDRFHPYGTLEQAEDVVKALRKCNYIVIRKHGVVAVGETLDEAMKLIMRMYGG